MRNFFLLKEAMEPELGPELRSKVGSEVDKDSASLLSLLSRLWAFVGGFAN